MLECKSLGGLFLCSTLLLAVGGCGSDSESGSGGSGGATGGTGGGGVGGGTGGTGATGGAGGTSGAAGSGGNTLCTLASSWQVVDDFLLTPGQMAVVVGVAADSNGNVYAAGLAKPSASPGMVGVVRKSSDGGETWTDAGWTTGAPNDIAADDAGNIYVAAGENGRVVKKTTDGVTWTDVDQYPLGSSDPNEPCNTGFVATGPGGVLVDGASCDNSGWIVRKSTSGGSFQQAFTFQLVAGKPARLEDVAVGPDGAAYALGTSQDGTDVPHWMIVSEGAATASVVDDFQLAVGQSANPRSFGGTSTALLVAGFASDGNTTSGLLRRASADAWSTIDSFAGRSFDVVELGNTIVVAGTLTDASSIDRVVTRISTDAGATFGPLDEYSYVAGQHSRPTSLTRDPAGSIYGTVGGQDAGGVTHWLVRKLACE